ncbi:hypothetical protein [Paenibacillus xanthanilyticus]|uniref:F5/8 type C domain-containing protein n=1 Tax=Paenibacillus xanthanilyticus TaxID=1783531 RepID=A0ABV8K6V6_9BACL
MAKLPSGLRTFDAAETVRRIAQNENIEATDKLFHEVQGHKHTGAPGDGPQIGTAGLANNAVTSAKLGLGSVNTAAIGNSAVTPEKISPNTLGRQQLRSGGLSGNIAKYAPVTVSAGTLTGNPTAPYTLPSEPNMWQIPRDAALPAELTIKLDARYGGMEGITLGSSRGSDRSRMPKNFYIDGSADSSSWVRLYTHTGSEYEPFQYFPFAAAGDWQFIKVVVTEHREGTNPTELSCIAVYTRSYGDVNLNALDDIRPWGLNARMQGLIMMPEGQIADNGTGTVTIGNAIIVMNPASGTYFRIAGGAYALPTWGYLYADIPVTGHGVQVTPQIGAWVDGKAHYGHRNRIIIAQRSGSGNIFFNGALQARLFSTHTVADSVDGIDFRVNEGRLEYNNNGGGWKGVGIKSVQRGVTPLKYDPNSNTYDTDKTVWINTVDTSKAFINISYTGYGWAVLSGQILPSDVTVQANFVSPYQIQLSTKVFLLSHSVSVSWEVIEFA